MHTHSLKRKTIGIAWYRRKDYPALRAILDDAQMLPADHDTWLSKAYSVALLEMALGNDIVKVMIDPAAFLAWCDATRQRVDCRARNQYVQFIIDTYIQSPEGIQRLATMPSRPGRVTDLKTARPSVPRR
jgi:hypothetical protein